MSTHSSHQNSEAKPHIEAEKVHHEKSHSSSKDFQKDLKGWLGSLDKLFTEWFVQKAPSLPVNVKEGLVKYLPIINLIGIILSGLALVSGLFLLIPLLALLGTVGFFAPLSAGQSFLGLIIGYGLSGFSLYFSVIAQRGLNTQQKSAWNNLWYAQLVSVASTILSLFSSFGATLFTLVFNALFLYLLYQLKKYYKN